MSTAARPAVHVDSSPVSNWPAWGICGADVVSLEVSFLLGLAVRVLLSPYFVASIGTEQYLGVAGGMLLLPLVHYQLGLYPGYLLSPVERLRRRVLATLGVFGALIAWDSLVARGVLSRGVLLTTFL